jgi:hypothetical protein
MSSKYCSKCARKLPISSFLKDALASPSSRVYSTSIQCRTRKIAFNSKKRAALQSLDPNIQPVKRVCSFDGLRPTVTCPQALLPPNLPVELPLPNPPPLPPNLPVELALPNPLFELQPPQASVTVLPLSKPTGFLPTDE